MLVKNYIERMGNLKNYSENTINNYQRILYNFNIYLQKNNKSLEKNTRITLLDIEKYTIELKKAWNNVNTCNNYLFAIKNFFKYCYLHDYKVLDFNKILFWQTIKNKIEACKEIDVRRLITAVKKKKYKNKVLKYRDLAVIYTLLWTWLRVSELIQLEIKDLWDTITIKWKWGKIRCVPFPKKYREYIDIYIKHRDIKSTYIFCSHAANCLWNKLSKTTIENIIKDLSKCAWIDATRPHKLRHTYATMLLRRGISIYIIQKLLWHASIDTTQKYLTCYNEDLLKATAKLPNL